MTTIVNNPPPETEGGGNSFLIGVIILVVFAFLLWYFGVPAINNLKGPIQLNIPAPQIVVPNKIDVNVNQTK